MSNKLQNNNIHNQKSSILIHNQESSISIGIQTPINKYLQFCLNKSLNKWLCLSLLLSFIVLGNINLTFAETKAFNWGSVNYYGELGNGTNDYGGIQYDLPVQVLGLTNVTAVAGGSNHSLALRTDGTVWAWGSNAYGELGDGTNVNSNLPRQVIGLTNVTAISGGHYHSLALRSDGTVWAWGYNYYGQLGTGSTVGGISSTPVQVSGLTNMTAIASSGSYNLALRSGTVWAWGKNEIGYGTYSNLPVQLSGLTDVTAIAAPPGGTLAIRSDYTVWAWGGSSWDAPSGLINVIAIGGGGQYRAVVKILKITGRITSGGNSLSGVSVALSGDSSATTTTDENGNFSSNNLRIGGNYTVTPSLAGYTFTPPSRTFNNLTESQTANFTATGDGTSFPTPTPYPTSALETIKKYAPLVYLHSNENYRPGNPMTFIQNSKLGWSHQSTVAGFPCGDHFEEDTGAIDASRLGEASSSPYVHKPKDTSSPICHHREDIELKASDYTRPFEGSKRDNILGELNGYMKEGFFLEPVGEQLRYGIGDGAPAFYEYVKGKYVSYWFFYPYNEYRHSVVDLPIQAHDGDWEHISIQLDSNDVAVNVFYAAHDGGKTIRWGLVNKYEASDHPIVFSARGSHAAYPRADRYDVKGPAVITGADYTDYGPKWFTWNNLLQVDLQPWYGFGGAWGQVGELPKEPFGVDFVVSGADYTGPLGPSRYKNSINRWSSSMSTGTGQNVTVASNKVALNFNNVSTAGNTVATVVSQDQLQPLPAGYSLPENAPMYDITSSAVFSGNIKVTFNVPNIANETVCSQLRILHYINNNWDISYNANPVYNSSNQTCTVSQTVTSLSPFVVAQYTGSTYSISGRVTNNGNSLSGVSVALSGSTSNVATTDSSGNYSFFVNGDGSYTVAPFLTNYTFAPASSTFNSIGVNQTANFAASSNCSFAINPTSVAVASAGGVDSIAIVSPSGCIWTAVSNNNWLSVTSSGSSGNGTVSYSVAVNSGTARTGTITIGGQIFTVNQAAAAAQFYEADVAQRPNGDGLILSDDVVQIRRFSNGTHTPDQTTNEFQRADSAPFATRGDGKILSDDVVQARRYQNGTNPKQTAAGPMTLSAGKTVVDQLFGGLSKTVFENAVIYGVQREVRIESARASAGQTVTVNIRVDSAGDESEYGFVLNYDSGILSNPVIGAGSAGASVRSCNASVAGQINCSVGGFADNNTNSADSGIGEVGAGTNQVLMTVTFTVAANAATGDTPLTLSNVNASSDAPQLFTPTATNGTVTRVSVRQRYRMR